MTPEGEPETADVVEWAVFCTLLGLAGVAFAWAVLP